MPDGVERRIRRRTRLFFPPNRTSIPCYAAVSVAARSRAKPTGRRSDRGRGLLTPRVEHVIAFALAVRFIFRFGVRLAVAPVSFRGFLFRGHFVLYLSSHFDSSFTSSFVSNPVPYSSSIILARFTRPYCVYSPYQSSIYLVPHWRFLTFEDQTGLPRFDRCGANGAHRTRVFYCWLFFCIGTDLRKAREVLRGRCHCRGRCQRTRPLTWRHRKKAEGHLRCQAYGIRPAISKVCAYTHRRFGLVERRILFSFKFRVDAITSCRAQLSLRKWRRGRSLATR